ncbi:MAG: hypothetical protein K5668_04430 [Lachnospiraceae bacterium]|nr:hypothetical protein [Lachnospiraceae bacterium]
MIAKKRGLDPEIASMAAMLHDLHAYKTGSCDGCMAGLIDMYQDYIDGKKEIKEINMAGR